MRVYTKLYPSATESPAGSLLYPYDVYLLYAGSYTNLNFSRRFYKSVLKWLLLM
jgi:hypothetical protein